MTSRAQVAALLLRFPDPPALTKTSRRRGELTDLVSSLRASGLLGASQTEPNFKRELDLPAARATRSSVIDKFNPYHDERGRFTTANAAVEPTESPSAPPKDVEAAQEDRTQTDVGASASTRQTSSSERKDGPRPILQASLVPLSCSDAFRACAQIAAFQRPSLILNCTAALRACRNTGLPTIFAPGIVGQQ